MNTDFFGSDYKEPVETSYLKFKRGENKFRILGSFKDGTAIMGLEYWETIDGQRKPKRVTVDTVVEASKLELNKFGEIDYPKLFWAVPVYSWDNDKIMILEIKQKSIRDAIKAYINNPKWGDPKQYDIVVTQVEDSGKIKYVVMPDPKEELDPIIIQRYKDAKINLSKLFSGGNPFGKDEKEETVDAEEVSQGIDKLRATIKNIK